MRVAVAGTFGPIHDGHRALFREALRLGDEGVLVALTSDELAQRTRQEPRPVPSYTVRMARVMETLEELDEWGRKVEVRELQSEHGIAIDEPSLDALVVSLETVEELEDINDTRRARGFDPLVGIVVPYVLADDGRRISSTRVVKGEIDEHGNVEM